MYAVIETGGKQYRVAPGQTVRVEKLPAEDGAEVTFEKVLLVADGEAVKVGTPYVEGGRVTARVKAQGRHRKVTVIKFKRRKGYRRTKGHRQHYTEVEITGIEA